MKHNLEVTIASLLSILLTSLHHADDVVRGMAPGKFSNLVPVIFLLAWLFGTPLLAERRSGYVIILVGSFLSSSLPAIHMMWAGLVGGRTADSSGAFFFSGRSLRSA
jgi:hypothetical protein